MCCSRHSVEEAAIERVCLSGGALKMGCLSARRADSRPAAPDLVHAEERFRITYLRGVPFLLISQGPVAGARFGGGRRRHAAQVTKKYEFGQGSASGIPPHPLVRRRGMQR